MTINISIPDVGPNLHPQITVLGVGGSGGNAVNNMINSNLEGVEFAIANTDSQALQISGCKKKIQLGIKSTRGLGMRSNRYTMLIDDLSVIKIREEKETGSCEISAAENFLKLI